MSRLQDYIYEWSEEDTIESLTNWQVIDYWNKLQEMYDEKHKVSTVMDTNNLFQTMFFINDIKYYFMAKNIKDNIWNIQFFPAKNNILHGNLKGSQNVGMVFAAIFQSLRTLINKHQVDGIVFVPEDKDLERVYTKMIPWIEKRFPLFKQSAKFVYMRK